MNLVKEDPCFTQFPPVFQQDHVHRPSAQLSLLGVESLVARVRYGSCQIDATCMEVSF